MRPLSAMERFFERLIERPTAWLFRPRLRPVQLQRRVERAMEHGRLVRGTTSHVPDRFTVRLNPGDLRTLEPAPGLPADLASGALAFARTRGYSLGGRPRVEIVGDPSVATGDIHVEAGFTEPGSDPILTDVGPELGGTRAFRVPVVRAPQATLHSVDPAGRTTTVVSAGEAFTIGRDGGNRLVLADPRVSREHARLQARDGVLVLTDLGSSNGTWVNGARVREIVIGEADRIEIGDSTITVVAVDHSRPDGASLVAAEGPATIEVDGR